MHQIDGVRRTRWPAGVALLAAGGLLLTGCAAGSSGAAASATATPIAVERPAAPEGELPAELQSQLQAALEQTMAEYGVPGAAAGVWIPGEGSWTTAAGLADVENGAARVREILDEQTVEVVVVVPRVSRVDPLQSLDITLRESRCSAVE